MARKILLADDSVTAQNMGRKILSDAGYEVITVNNGSAALKKIAEHRPDLIVLDVYMPGYSGLEVCQRLKETQETARIPVLLTVGKLEPFKAEEAHRVRADGFIVKPFEASELLSALSKLEDKVVPRSEPSKPGRFARAIAAVEESNRTGREGGGDDTGWKERLTFPGKKKKADAEPPKGPDEAATYNAVNRDLRTVVEKPAAEKELKPVEAEISPAVAQALPKDVTPEELAAIAAAMSQMQGKLDRAQQAAEEIPSTAPVAQAAAEPAVTSAVDLSAVARSDSNAETSAPEKVEAINEAIRESALAEAIASLDKAQPESTKAEEQSEEQEDAPVTMAAAAGMAAGTNGQGVHWTAVSVPLASDEATISLEREMQQAYAALAAAEANHPGFVDSQAQAQPHPENSVAAAEPVANISHAQPEDAISAAVAEPVPSFVDAAPPQVSAMAAASPAEPSTSFAEQIHAAPAQTPEPVPVEAHSEPVAAHEAVPQISTEEQAAVSGFAVPSATEAIATASVPEPAPVYDPQPEMAMAAAASTADTRTDSQPPQSEQSETVASTAAAWATWRQTHDAGAENVQAAEPSPAQFENSAPAQTQPEPAAVASEAEKIVEQVAASQNADPSSIASIVESVLAEMRPRLVEEISRKMAQKK